LWEQIRPFECGREREKWGERERGSRGIFPPTLLHAGTAGCGGIRGGGGGWRGRGGGSGGSKEMTGGPARQRRARGVGAEWAAGEEEKGGGKWAEPAQE
jgi:hypothetical protein